jgi:two-component system nitrogen regulation response regulator GlnG
MPHLLIVDDEPGILHAFRRALREPAFTLTTAASAAEALAAVRRSRPDVIVLDVHLPDATGLDTFEQLRRLDARIPVILITGHGTTDLAIEAIKRGAYEYLLKPLELGPLRELIDRACASSRLMQVPAVVDGAGPLPPSADVLVGRCPAMQEVYKAIGRVAPQDVIVLIRGESGTGKELVARAIYQHSRRADRPFLALNCAAIPETLLESELFGHEKGAFTGAERKRIGKFEQCNGGTLFLDEVGDMSPLTQVKILRLLQEQSFERVGGSETIRCDVRLIAATNVDLEKLVSAGRFRTDLYFRLNGFTIRLPPLRERGDDLTVLIDYHVRRFSRELDRPVHALPLETLELLRRYSWPGNVRELQSVLKQALLQMSGSVLLPEFLPAPLHAPAAGNGAGTASAETPGIDLDRFIEDRLQAGSEDLYAESLGLLERRLLTRVLQQTAGNQVQAARILGITRSSLRTKIRALRISIGRTIYADDDQPE